MQLPLKKNCKYEYLNKNLFFTFVESSLKKLERWKKAERMTRNRKGSNIFIFSELDACDEFDQT